MNTQAKTVGALRQSGYESRSVKQEMRQNLIGMLRSGSEVFPGIVGYEDTVVPQLVNAVLSRHDMLLLGLRGQAKTRLIRMLPRLLDEWMPAIAASDLPDDPLKPLFSRNRSLLEAQGDELEIRWIHRDDRFHEKLATPDVTVADLIGEIDLVKHAEGRHLSDEGVIHYGLIPRTNRGIFAINELPDLAPKIQVALFNALEERDVQIRGFPVRIPLDVCMAFSANPEDYTNRGRIVTPLKDRIGSVIRTHYPVRAEHGMTITMQNAWLDREETNGNLSVPRYMFEILEETVRIARKSPHVNQQSGVSVRTAIASAEVLVSNAERRCIRHGETTIVPRITDLQHLGAASRGKVELMLAEDDQAEEKLIASISGEAVKSVFDRYHDLASLEDVVEAFGDGQTTVEIGDAVATEDLLLNVEKLAPLKNAAVKVCEEAGEPADVPAHLAAAAEFVLDALFVSNRLSKYAYHGKSMFKR